MQPDRIENIAVQQAEFDEDGVLKLAGYILVDRKGPRDEDFENFGELECYGTNDG